MELYHILRRMRTILTAVCIITAIFLSSCRAGGPQDPDRSAVLSLLEPLEIAAGKGEGSLYDLTSLFGEDAGSVCAYGLKSEYSLLFLQREAADNGNPGSQFALRLLDLRDGSQDGFDIPLTRAIARAVNIPVIASGGVGKLEHFAQGILEGEADAVLAASVFHFGTFTVRQVKDYLAGQGIRVRT